MKTELEVLQMAYNELRGCIDENCSSEYSTKTGSFYLKKNYEGEITRIYKKNGCQVEAIDDHILSILQKDYERDRPFSILIDNANKDKESFIFYHEEFFETKEQAKEKIAEIIEIANAKQKQIKCIEFLYRNMSQFYIYFNEENKIVRTCASCYYTPDEIIGGFDKSFYCFNDFIGFYEIPLSKKLKFLSQKERNNNED